MLGTQFYFKSLRNLSLGFGTLFDNVEILREDDNSNTSKLIQVPLSYAPREHYMATLRDKVDSIQTILPRMSYEMTGLNYDPTRKMATLGYNKSEINTPAVQEFYKQLNPVPYTVDFELNIYTRTIDDGLQIIEQIAPYFTPDFNITVIEMPELGMKRDVSVTLESITPQDTWEAMVEETRIVSWTLAFSAKTYIYPPMTQSKVILTAITQLKTHTAKVAETIQVEVDPLTAKESEVWAAKTTIT